MDVRPVAPRCQKAPNPPCPVVSKPEATTLILSLQDKYKEESAPHKLVFSLSKGNLRSVPAEYGWALDDWSGKWSNGEITLLRKGRNASWQYFGNYADGTVQLVGVCQTSKTQNLRAGEGQKLEGTFTSNRAPQPIAMPKAPKIDHVDRSSERNVVVVGNLQSGKTTFINTWLRYLNQDDNMPAIGQEGKGTIAETRFCSSYPMQGPMTLYKIGLRKYHFKLMAEWGDKPKEDREISDALIDAWWSDSNWNQQPVTSTESLKFTMIDTPGLDDIAQGDDSIVLDVCNTLIRSRTLSAVIFVVKKGTPFGDSLQSTVRYYQMLLGGLGCSFIMLHTNWTNSDDEDYDQQTKERQEQIDPLFKDIAFTHVFVDLKLPTGRAAKRSLRQRKALLTNSLSILYRYILASNQTDVGSMTIPLTKNMKTKAAALLSSLDVAANATRSTLEKTNSSLQLLVPRLTELETQIAQLQARIQSDQARLLQIDTSEEVMIYLKDYSHWGYVFSSRIEHVLVCQPCRISNYKTDVGFRNEWVSQTLVEHNTKFEGDLKAPPWTSLWGSLALFASMRDKHREEIENTRLGCQKDQDLLLVLQNHLRSLLESLENFKVEIAIWQKDLKSIACLQHFLNLERQSLSDFTQVFHIFSSYQTKKEEQRQRWWLRDLCSLKNTEVLSYCQNLEN